MLYRVWHRSWTNCTTDEAWTKSVFSRNMKDISPSDAYRYIVLNRNGSANLLEVSSRGYDPVMLFNQMK
jgi:hypothetical protein